MTARANTTNHPISATYYVYQSSKLHRIITSERTHTHIFVAGICFKMTNTSHQQKKKYDHIHILTSSYASNTHKVYSLALEHQPQTHTQRRPSQVYIILFFPKCFFYDANIFRRIDSSMELRIIFRTMRAYTKYCALTLFTFSSFILRTKISYSVLLTVWITLCY